MPAHGAGAVAARMWCRLVGHKWMLMAGISHGDDELYECRRCGAYDWRDLPEHASASIMLRETAPTAEASEERSTPRPSGRAAAAPGRRR